MSRRIGDPTEESTRSIRLAPCPWCRGEAVSRLVVDYGDGRLKRVAVGCGEPRMGAFFEGYEPEALEDDSVILADDLVELINLAILCAGDRQGKRIDVGVLEPYEIVTSRSSIVAYAAEIQRCWEVMKRWQDILRELRHLHSVETALETLPWVERLALTFRRHGVEL